MEVLQSVVIIVQLPCQVHIVGETIIPPLFAMYGQAVVQRNVGEQMVANVDNMRTTFIKCNNTYFEGKLPEPSFGLVHTYNTCANFYYSYDRWFGRKFYDYIIRKVSEAIKILYNDDIFLLKSKMNEMTVCGRLAMYLQEKFKD